MSDFAGDSSSPQLALLQTLRGWRAAGVTHLPKVTMPAPEVSTKAVVTSEASEEVVLATAPTVLNTALPTDSKDEDMARKSAAATPAASQKTEDRAARLAALAKKVAVCLRCKELAAERTQTVFGVGDPHARIMFIGEAPGADEDRVGEPFVGRAGQLLNKIIEACGWKREDLYICNILRCRPPGNRNPSPEEASNCREYLDGQIEIVDPDFIVCWGSVAAKNLLGTEESIGKLRQKWFQHGRARVLCTYHPSYLLRNPSAKRPVWDDMQLLMKEVAQEG